MFTIGDFAKLGRVSIRMLRHYDAIGLLRPAAVDDATGYRFYEAAQLQRLNRIIALKDLGFTLDQIGTIADDKITALELAGMLRLRRAQLEAQLSADAARLTSVEARLRLIEKEGHMPTADVVLKPIAPIRIAELSGTAAGYGPEHITPTIGPLYDALMMRLGESRVTMTGAPVAYYEPEAGESSDAVVVHAGVPVAVDASDAYPFEVIDLPPIESAATLIHRGSMDDVMESLHGLASWIEDNGYQPLGYHREVYVDYDPAHPDNGVTELQIAVVKA
jgi:DNA-binding transcriptional MerR regulator